ncbi:hypothetical protein SUGI_0176810 [Cryptomeria japonica]|nr:hypothetical protein SUGI_0176810 [Cryptomeria japonica]
MLTKKLSQLRSKVSFSAHSQDKRNQYSRTDTSCSANSEFDNSDLLSHSTEDKNVKSDSGASHAEYWFPTEPVANLKVKPIDFSYAESQTSNTKVSLGPSAVSEEDINIGPPVLPPYEHLEEQFLEDYEDYFAHLSVDNIRKEQYPKLDLQSLVYLDYANFALFSRFQVEEHMHMLLEEGPCLGSVSMSDFSHTQLTYYIENTQERLFQLLNTRKEDYSIIFTNGATAGFRVFGDLYPFQRGSFMLVCQDNHVSVNHSVQSAARKGARIAMSPVGELDLCMHGPELRRLLKKQEWNSGGTGLFIYPAQSCLSGVRHSLNWIVEAQQNGWEVLLDVSSYLPLGSLDLSLYQPEFVVGSFHHMLGYPSGTGFLLVNRKFYSIIKAKYSDRLTLMASPKQGRSFHVVSEDDSINLLTFAALAFGLEHLEIMGQTALQKRSDSLAAWLLITLKSLKHKSDEGQPLLKVYGSSICMYRGSIISFNVMDSTGNILPANLIQWLAKRNNIVVGVGSFGNPGLGHILSKSQERINGSNMFDKEYNFSAVRVSLGPVSTFKDRISPINVFQDSIGPSYSTLKII